MSTFIVRAHNQLMFPFLIITMVLVNQPDKYLVFVGQCTGWFSYVFASVIIYNAFQKKLLIYLLFFFILTTKALSILSTSSFFDVVYIIGQNTLFCIAGTILAFLRPNLYYRQIMVFCILNVIFMLFQISGLGGKIVMMLTTHGEGVVPPEITLFQLQDQINYLLIQGRPAGLTQANIILSLIVMLAVAIHFSRQKRVFAWGTVVLSLLITLSMAKMAFLGFVVSGMLILIGGQRFQKARILKASLFILIFILLYWFFFPGLAAVNLSRETLNASIFLRANDIMFAFNPEFLSLEGKPYFEGTSFFYGAEEGEFVSGIASVVSKFYNNLDIIFILLVLLLYFYQRGLKSLRMRFPSMGIQIVSVFVVIIIFPVTHPIWPFQIYWFFLGYGLLPFYTYFNPRFLTNNLEKIT